MEVRTSIEGNKATIELAGKLTVNVISDLEAAFDGLPPAVRDLDGLRLLSGASRNRAREQAHYGSRWRVSPDAPL